MSISVEEVKKLAALSRIRLSDEEVISMQEEIGSILGYVEQINNVSIKATAEIPERRNVWREDNDVNESGVYTEKLLNNAPATENGYVKVKKIL